MLKILFVDFDGVLWPRATEIPVRQELLVEFFDKHPDARIVISSNWRFQHQLEELVWYFPKEIHSKIIGTLDLRDEGGGPARQEAIKRWLRECKEPVTWAVLDDTPGLFQLNYSRLVLTDRTRGFTAEDLLKVEEIWAGT